jgi:hypothetical protein
MNPWPGRAGSPAARSVERRGFPLGGLPRNSNLRPLPQRRLRAQADRETRPQGQHDEMEGAAQRRLPEARDAHSLQECCAWCAPICPRCSKLDEVRGIGGDGDSEPRRMIA